MTLFPKAVALIAASLVALSAAAAGDQSVNLPYMQPDKDGNQWMVTYYGYLQQQGQMPVYSTTGVLSINGAPATGRVVQRQAKIDAKTGELVMENLQVGSVTLTRRFQFNKEDGYVRIIDVLRNPQNRDQQVQLNLSANANYGVQSGQTIPDAKK